MSEAHTTAWLDGELVALDRAAPLLTGRGEARHGLFETMRVTAGRVPLWDRHLERLERSLAAHDRVLDRGGLTAAARALLAANAPDGADVVLRLTVVFGAGDRRLLTSRALRPSHAQALVVATPRRGAEDRTGSHKVVDRTFYDAALAEARAHGADDALLLGPADEVWETAVASVLASVDGETCTPALAGPVLPGVARAVLCERLDVVERPIDLSTVRRADGLWTINAVHGPRVAILDGRERDVGGDRVRAAWRAALAAASPPW